MGDKKKKSREYFLYAFFLNPEIKFQFINVLLCLCVCVCGGGGGGERGEETGGAFLSPTLSHH